MYSEENQYNVYPGQFILSGSRKDASDKFWNRIKEQAEKIAPGLDSVVWTMFLESTHQQFDFCIKKSK
jgi:hypothetical protein